MAFKLFKKKGKEGETAKKPKKKKSALREWIDAIVFAVIAATIIRWAFFSAYTIPTPSMEGTQLVGDFLFVSKISYGPRTPKTILRLPLTDNKIWGTNMPSYLNWIQLPTTRIPGYTSVKRNDIVVFNYPEEDAPVDMKTHYIKRCVAIAGDELKIEDTQVYVNGEAIKNPSGLQFRYLITSNQTINSRVIKRNKLDELGFGASKFQENNTSNQYSVETTPENAKKLEAFPFITKVERITSPKGQANERVFPQGLDLNWNEDFYGPVTIPKKGMTIDINAQNLAYYGKVIKRLDGNDPDEVEIDGEILKIDGEEVTSYTFKQDYFFMMGDNRHNSLDSRFWGFVPKDHVVGQAWFTWLSLDYSKPFLSRIRWNRIFSSIE